MSFRILDGPLGTELEARAVPTPLPGWSAHALEGAPEVVAAIHRDYAAAGATIHTANTFRTRPALFPDRWQELARRAVRIAREALPEGQRLAGSIAPLADCYRPDLSPVEHDPEGTRSAHRSLARVLADAGCDLLLCETFPHVAEGLIALEEAVASGLDSWISFTPGPNVDLLSLEEVARGAREAVERGARAVLVNCLPPDRALDFVRALRHVAPAGIPVGVYANTGCIDDQQGWRVEPEALLAPQRYADLAEQWIAAGASIVGGCCGTGPAHVTALAARRES